MRQPTNTNQKDTTKMSKMSTNEMTTVTSLFEKMSPGIHNLYWRWLDESAHEGWDGYADAMKRWLPAEAAFVKAGRRPFGVTFKLAGKTYVFAATSSEVSWKRIA